MEPGPQRGGRTFRANLGKTFVRGNPDQGCHRVMDWEDFIFPMAAAAADLDSHLPHPPCPPLPRTDGEKPGVAPRLARRGPFSCRFSYCHNGARSPMDEDEYVRSLWATRLAPLITLTTPLKPLRTHSPAKGDSSPKKVPPPTDSVLSNKTVARPSLLRGN